VTLVGRLPLPMLAAAPVKRGAGVHAGDDRPSRFRLTSREADVARLLARGESNARIASLLAISPHTARRHTEAVMLKLGVHSRAAVGSALRGERA
jgi:DNA-binding NarL/FixJ family response regulator